MKNDNEQSASLKELRESAGSKNEITLFNDILEFANSCERFKYPFDENAIPKNGIYIFFEKGEVYNGTDRIVMVGTHTGQDNLCSRLKEHLYNENKDRSIFRKNIGRALLNKDNNPFLDQWNLDLTTKDSRDKYVAVVDFKKQKETEERVSSYMREKLSFCVISMDEIEDRKNYKNFLIKSVSANHKCLPSANWLGNYSPDEKIKESGMWNVRGLA